MMNRAVLSSLVFASVTLVSLAARADETQAPPAAPAPPPVIAPTAPFAAPSVATTNAPSSAADDAADLGRLRAFVARGRAPVASYRLAGGLTGLGLGAVATPIGAVMFGRDTTSVGAGVVLGAGIGSAVGGALVLTGLFDDDPYAAVDEAITKEKGLGHDDHAAVLAGEAELKKKVESIRTGRTVAGAVVIGLGVASLGAGTVFGLADFTGPKLERREQDAVAAAFMAYGVLSTLVGVQSLLFPTPVESAWDGYSAAKRSQVASAPRLLGLNGGPLPGGGASLGFTGLF